MNKILEKFGFCWHTWPRWSEPYDDEWNSYNSRTGGMTMVTIRTQKRKCFKCDAMKYKFC